MRRQLRDLAGFVLWAAVIAAAIAAVRAVSVGDAPSYEPPLHAGAAAAPELERWQQGFYRARFVAAHDGDTPTLLVNVARRVWVEDEYRLVGDDGAYFNAPELRGPHPRKAREALEALRAELSAEPVLYVVTERDGKGRDETTFARVLARVYVPRDGRLVNVTERLARFNVPQGD